MPFPSHVTNPLQCITGIAQAASGSYSARFIHGVFQAEPNPCCIDHRLFRNQRHPGAYDTGGCHTLASHALSRCGSQINRADLNSSKHSQHPRHSFGHGGQFRARSAISNHGFVGNCGMAGTVFYTLFMASIYGAISRALAAAFPRSMGQSGSLPPEPNLYFSGHIILMGPADYAMRFGFLVGAWKAGNSRRV